MAQPRSLLDTDILSADDYRKISLIGVAQLVQRDAALKAVIDAEPGAAFERRDPDEAFVPVKNWTPRSD